MLPALFASVKPYAGISFGIAVVIVVVDVGGGCYNVVVLDVLLL